MAVHPYETPPIHPLTVDDVDAMLAAGILDESDKVELIDGVLVKKMGQDPEHIDAVVALNMLLVPAAAASEMTVRPQVPLDVRSDISLPEPDMVIVPADARGRDPMDALLVVEVSKSSLRFDLGRKALLYATAGYAEYWVLDVVGRRLHVHTGPVDGRYESVVVYDDRATVSATRVAFSAPVADLLG